MEPSIYINSAIQVYVFSGLIAMLNVGAMTGLAAVADLNQGDMVPAIAAIVNAINEN